MIENAALAAIEAHKDAIDQARRNVAYGWRGSGSQWLLSLALVAIETAVRADIEGTLGVCLACAEDIHHRCSGSAGVPCRCLHPLHAGTTYGVAAREIWHRAMRVLADDPEQTFDTGHVGHFVWKNGAEQVWECAEDCPHPSHEEQS